jgi:hypothetical protein
MKIVKISMCGDVSAHEGEGWLATNIDMRLYFA